MFTRSEDSIDIIIGNCCPENWELWDLLYKELELLGHLSHIISKHFQFFFLVCNTSNIRGKGVVGCGIVGLMSD